MPIIVPSIDMEFSAQFSEEAPLTVKYIRQNYQDMISAAGKDIGVDPDVIIGFMVIESGKMDGSGQVNPHATSPAGAEGLLQLMPATAYDTLTRQAPVMTSMQSTIVSKYLPGFIKIGNFTGFYKNWKSKILSALYEPEFNIWTGTMQLAQLMKTIIDKNNGVLNMAQVVVAYNAGLGNYDKYVTKQNLSSFDSTALVAGLQQEGALKESRQYIIKLLGKNGSLIAALRNPA